ncbi:MAG: HEPN domain-containing protein [Chloroflexota bacterium]|nr:HEPN domain-containing protein [Chloroflexota bacterium]
MSDQPEKPVETPKVWIQFAEGDLAVAQREMQSELPVYHTICFLCQSAAEKFLKGYLISAVSCPSSIVHHPFPPSIILARS